MLGDSESEASWGDMFTLLRELGLPGVYFVVSEADEGMFKALNCRLRRHVVAALSSSPGKERAGPHAPVSARRS